MTLEYRRHRAKLRRNYAGHDHSDKLASVPDNQCNRKKHMLLMRKRCSVLQGESCSHARYYFVVLDFRVIAISRNVALILLIILIRNSHTYQCL